MTDVVRGERERQAAYLFSIIQSAENCEGGGAESVPEKAFDAGILYAARLVLDNEAGDNDWRDDVQEYAGEIRGRAKPGTPLPAEPVTVAEVLARLRSKIGACPLLVGRDQIEQLVDAVADELDIVGRFD